MRNPRKARGRSLALALVLVLASAAAQAATLTVTLGDGPDDDVLLSPDPNLGLWATPGSDLELITSIQGAAQDVTLTIPLPACMVAAGVSGPQNVTIEPADKNAIVDLRLDQLKISGLTIPSSGHVVVRLHLSVGGASGQACCTQSTVSTGYGKSVVSIPALAAGRDTYRGRGSEPYPGNVCYAGSTGFRIVDLSASAPATE